MTAEVVAAVVAVILALVGGAAGWIRTDQHGAERERRKQADQERDAANTRADKAEVAPASKREAIAILDRLRALRERKLRKTSGRR